MFKDDIRKIKEDVYTKQAEVVAHVANLAGEVQSQAEEIKSNKEFILDLRRRLNAALDMLGTARQELEYSKHPDFGKPEELIKRIEKEIPKLNDVSETYEEDFDLSRCPRCGGDADQGHDRCYPPNPYVCSKCQKKSEESQSTDI